MTAAFDEDSAVADLGGGRYEARISPRWNIGDKPNGGYLMAVAARAVGAALPQPDPLSVTAHFLRPPQPGSVTIDVEPVRSGRAHSSATARVDQDGTERLRLLAVFADHGAPVDGPRALLAAPPAIAPLKDCEPGRPDLPGGVRVALSEQFASRFDPSTTGWTRGEPSRRGQVGAWVRFADGREPDPYALLLVVDALPPTAFDLGVAGWVPTLEMTVHVRARPVPGWLRVWVRTRLMQDGYLEEDCEVWDAADRLVAMSRQLALVPRSR